MPSFTSVQAYADNNPKLSAIPYEQAKGSEVTNKLVVPRVRHTTSSNAGASSSLFHEYRNGRRREMKRVRQLESEWEQDQIRAENEKRRRELESFAESKTTKKAARRKHRKIKQKVARMMKKKNKTSTNDTSDTQQKDEINETMTDDLSDTDIMQQITGTNDIIFSNDGSFLKEAKQKLQTTETSIMQSNEHENDVQQEIKDDNASNEHEDDVQHETKQNDTTSIEDVQQETKENDTTSNEHEDDVQQETK